MVGVLGPGVGAQSGPRSLAQGFVHAGHCVGSATSRGLDFLSQPWAPWSSLEQVLQMQALHCTIDLLSQPGQTEPMVGARVAKSDGPTQSNLHPDDKAKRNEVQRG